MDENTSNRSRVPSEKKLVANRANAQRSTGPRTAEGKARSRLNSVKHGLLASEAVSRTMDGDAERELFDALCDEMEDRYQPRGPLEAILIEKIVVASWRLKRLLRFERKSTYEAELAENRAYAEWSAKHEGRINSRPEALRKAGVDGLRIPLQGEMLLLIRYEAAVNRDLYRAINELRKVQQDRRRHQDEREDDAVAADEAPSAQESASVEAESDLKNQSYQTNPPIPEMNASESIERRTEGEDEVVGTSSG